MNNRLKIMRDGVPTYVAPWVADLSPAARKMIGTGPSRHDPKGQLGLPIPDPDKAEQIVLDFAPMPAKARPAKSDGFFVSELQASHLVALQQSLYGAGHKEHAHALWDLLCGITAQRVKA